MTACHHFTGRAYINKEPCGAKIDNQGKLDYWPCIHYGQGFCAEHTIQPPKVAVEKMDNYVDFSAHNERESEFTQEKSDG